MQALDCPAHHSAKLPHNDAARLDALAAIDLHAASLRVAVPPVLRRAACTEARSVKSLGKGSLLSSKRQAVLCYLGGCAPRSLRLLIYIFL